MVRVSIGVSVRVNCAAEEKKCEADLLNEFFTSFVERGAVGGISAKKLVPYLMGVWKWLIFEFERPMAKDCEGFLDIARHEQMDFVSGVWSSPSACECRCILTQSSLP